MTGLARLGMPRIDSTAVDDPAAMCRRLGRNTFLLSVAPARIPGLTGVPVNPIAVF